MHPDPRILLADVDRAAEDIAQFTEGMNRETYVGDARTQTAVERKFAYPASALTRSICSARAFSAAASAVTPGMT